MTVTRHIPNAITSLNLVFGSLGVICAFDGRLELSFPLMLAAAVADFCDGLTARALKAYSDIGKQLDSLSDLISFGLLPAVMLNRIMTESGNTGIWSYIPLVITVFSALRLARFNIDDRQTENFIGLATPACAILCGAMVHYICRTPDSFMAPWAGTHLFIPAISVVLAFLLVCDIPMFSLKFKRSQKASPVYRMRIGFCGFCVAAALAIFLLGLNFSMIFILAVLGYLAMNLSSWLTGRVASRH